MRKSQTETEMSEVGDAGGEDTQSECTQENNKRSLVSRFNVNKERGKRKTTSEGRGKEENSRSDLWDSDRNLPVFCVSSSCPPSPDETSTASSRWLETLDIGAGLADRKP